MNYLGLYIVNTKNWLYGLLFKIRSIEISGFLLKYIKNYDSVKRFLILKLCEVFDFGGLLMATCVHVFSISTYYYY